MGENKQAVALLVAIQGSCTGRSKLKSDRLTSTGNITLEIISSERD